ncbi:MAG TPA: DUF1648 domain-containing protein [Ktedonobacterales bacterium]
MGSLGDDQATRVWPSRRFRPHVRPPVTPGAFVANLITTAGLWFTIAPLVWWWSSIPDTVPSHFGANGQVDAYGPKATLLIYPAAAFCVTLLLQTLCRYPWIFNYPVRITAENAARQYVFGRLMLRWVNATVWLLGGFQWQALLIARGAETAISPAWLLLYIAAAALMPIILAGAVMVWALRGRS